MCTAAQFFCFHVKSCTFKGNFNQRGSCSMTIPLALPWNIYFLDPVSLLDYLLSIAFYCRLFSAWLDVLW